MDYWESAPSAQRWLCKDEEALPLPGEPSSRILHRQAMMLRGPPPPTGRYKAGSRIGKSRMRPGPGLIVQKLAPLKALCVALNSANPQSLVKST